MSFEQQSETGAVLPARGLAGPAGALEGLLNRGDRAANFCALICHPHPLGGGTMHNKVVYHAMKSFRSFGWPVLRFNFRGVGLSEGIHDEGRGEIEDARAALDWLTSQYGLPVLFAGFSFGAAVGLRAFCEDRRVHALAALGLPMRARGREYTYPFLERCLQPKLFLSGGEDEYGPRELIVEAVESAAPPKQLVFIEGADHFFKGKLEEMQGALQRWLSEAVFVEGPE